MKIKDDEIVRLQDLVKKNRENNKCNIPLVLESPNSKKMEKKEELNGIHTPLSTMLSN